MNTENQNHSFPLAGGRLGWGLARRDTTVSTPTLTLPLQGGGSAKQTGFTLLEVLVALFILAITMAAVSRTASSSIHHVDALRTRVIADWVAQNRLAIHQARGDYPAPGIQTGSEEQAGQTYPWQEEIIATPNPTMRRIVVNVYAPDDAKHSLRELTGYLVQWPR